LKEIEGELFGAQRVSDHDWLLDGHPAGPALILVAVTERDRIAGSIALVPWDLQVDGRRVRAGQSARLWTHPDFRLQGVFTALERELIRQSGEMGHALVFGFPNEAAIPGHRRVGMKIDPMLDRKQGLIRSRRLGIPGPVASLIDLPLHLCRRRAAARHGELWEITEDLARDADRIWDGLAGNPGVRGVRDAAYVRWRFGPDSGRAYRHWRYPRGSRPRVLAVTRGAGDRVHLVDVWGNSEAAETPTVIAALLEALEQRGVEVVDWAPSRYDRWSRPGLVSGVIRRRRTIPLVRWFTGPANETEGLSAITRYYINEGDSDHA
jgi:GNAT superfamily N-acetyltransferase